MKFILLLALIAVIVILIWRKRRKKSFRLKDEPVPHRLGFLYFPGYQLATRLNNSIPKGLKKNIKERMLKERLTWKDYDFEWRYFELKRYFVLNSLLKTVPMFSSHVDELWHEMLMFTKDYEAFSKKFYGGFLHHTPNMDVTPIPGERAFFDWVYLSLFKPKTNSHRLWGGFLKNPIKQEILEDFQQLSEEELLSLYFSPTADWTELKTYLIRKLKKEISEAKLLQDSNPSFHKIKSDQDYHLLLPAAVFFSLYGAEQYATHMGGLLPYQVAAASSSGGSSCSGYGCSSSSSKDDSGSSSCSSSCSSCGGGCS